MTIIAFMVYAGGMAGALDAVRGFWWAIFWPWHVTRDVLRRWPAP